MVKYFLSNFGTITKPSHQSDSIRPYLSSIIAIVFVTIIAYGLQITTTVIHSYAEKPTAVKTATAFASYCTNQTQTSLQFICNGMHVNTNKNQAASTLSLEQDLQSPIK